VAISGSASADPTPTSDTFSCGGGAFILTADGTIEQANSLGGTWTTLVSTGRGLNALAFNPADRYLYSLLANQTSLQRITTSGRTSLGAVGGLPAGNYPAGAIDVSTGPYYVSAANSLYAIDISTLTATSVTVPATFKGFGTDIVIAEGWLWTVKSGFVTGFDLTTGAVKNYETDRTLVPRDDVGGAMWMNSEGTTLYVQMKTFGVVAQIAGVGSASISQSVITSTNPVSIPIDGADCRKSTLTVTPDAKSRIYGESAPSYTFGVSGFVNGDTAETAAGYSAPNCSSSYSSTTTLSSSPVIISCSGGSADDYTFNTTATAQLTVSAKSLLVTPDAKSRNYGDAAPSYTFGVSGFVNGDTAETAAGYSAPNCSSSYSSTTTLSSSPVIISCSGGSADDYTFDTTATAELTVSAKSLLVTPDAKSRTYGEAAPTYTFDVTGFVNGDTAGTAAGYSAPSCSSSYSSTTPVSASTVTISCSGGSADDYTFDTTATAQLTVSAKLLTVTPGAKSRVYGESAPSYTFDVAGFTNGESAGTAAGYVAPICSSSYLSTTAVSASPLTISCSGGSADNYTFDTTATANLVVNYPTESVNCPTNQYFRLASGVLSSGSSFLRQFVFVASMGRMRNAASIRPADRRMYGFSAQNSNILYRGGIFGSQALGAVSGLPAAIYTGSDFDSSSGLLYVFSSRLGKLYSVDVDAMTATEVAVAAGYKFGFDIVVVNGHVWSYSEGSISSVRISNGNRLTWSTSPGISRSVLKNKSMVGAMWYDSATQTIYGEITSDGTLVKFSGIGSGTVVSSLVGASTGGSIPIDGTTCS
jgi:hypothetical protein